MESAQPLWGGCTITSSGNLVSYKKGSNQLNVSLSPNCGGTHMWIYERVTTKIVPVRLRFHSDFKVTVGSVF